MTFAHSFSLYIASCVCLLIWLEHVVEVVFKQQWLVPSQDFLLDLCCLHGWWRIMSRMHKGWRRSCFRLNGIRNEEAEIWWRNSLHACLTKTTRSESFQKVFWKLVCLFTLQFPSSLISTLAFHPGINLSPPSFLSSEGGISWRKWEKCGRKKERRWWWNFDPQEEHLTRQEEREEKNFHSCFCFGFHQHSIMEWKE